jgi:hypothetical protein
MSLFRNIFSELVERKLWPVALGLLAALIAVPVLLAKPADEGAPPSQAAPGSALLGANSAKLLGETQPAVSVRGDGGFRKRVNRLARKNPFVQQARSRGDAGESAQLPTSTTTGASTPTGGGTTPTGPTTTTPTGDNLRLYSYVAKVEFGRIGSTKEKNLDPGEFLPSENNPVLLYVTASNEGDKAMFVVTAGATARGDGECSPSASDCQLLTLRKDDVEFIEVPVSQDSVVTYELKLVNIVLKEIKNPPKVESKPITFQPNSHRIQEMRRAMRAKRASRKSQRTKRIFSALDQLGF